MKRSISRLVMIFLLAGSSSALAVTDEEFDKLKGSVETLLSSVRTYKDGVEIENKNFSDRCENIRDAIKAAVPVGTIFPYAGANIPEGFLACDGHRYRAPAPQNGDPDYSLLFAAIGMAYTPEGERNGGEFRVPDLRGRAPIGIGQGQLANGTQLTNRPLGEIIGAEAHVLTREEMPEHVHNVVDTGHNHNLRDEGHYHGGKKDFYFVTWQHSWTQMTNKQDSGAAIRTGDGQSLVPLMNRTAYAQSGISLDSAKSTIKEDAVGRSRPHNNMQPSLAIQYIIKYK